MFMWEKGLFSGPKKFQWWIQNCFHKRRWLMIAWKCIELWKLNKKHPNTVPTNHFLKPYKMFLSPQHYNQAKSCLSSIIVYGTLAPSCHDHSQVTKYNSVLVRLRSLHRLYLPWFLNSGECTWVRDKSWGSWRIPLSSVQSTPCPIPARMMITLAYILVGPRSTHQP